MILDTLIKSFRASLENPQVPLGALSEELEAIFTGGESDAGVRVNRKTALTLSALWRGVNVVSRDVAKIPCHLYQRVDDRKRRKARQHPAYRLLRKKPNAEMTAFIFKQTLISHALLQGNGYAYIYRGGDGSPQELVPLLPDRTYPLRKDGRLWYVTTIDNQMLRLSPADVIHIKGLGYDGLVGYNVLDRAKQSLGWALAMRKFSARFFKHGARSGGILMVPGTFDKEANESLQKSFEKKQAGLDNAHKTILLEEGAKYQPTSVTPDDAQFLASMEFSLIDVANWLNVAPHKVGHPSRTSYKSLQEENQKHLDEAIDPWLVVYEEETADKVLTEKQKRKDSHYVEFNRNALISVDFKTKIEGRAKQILSGELCPDEARAMENLPPRKDGQGGRYLLPKNMQFADAVEDDNKGGKRTEGNKGKEEMRRKKIEAAVRAVAVDAAGRVFNRVAREAKRAAGNHARFFSWLNSFDELRGVLCEIVGPAVGLTAAAENLRNETQARTVAVVASLLKNIEINLAFGGGAVEEADLTRTVEAYFDGRATAAVEEIANQIMGLD